MLIRLFFITALLLLGNEVLAKGVYLSVEDFVSESFDTNEAKAKTLWLQAEKKSQAERILNHSLGLRTRYWIYGERTAWVFEEIGKELPITIGVVVHAGRIVNVRILAFRESRGWEVRYPNFTKQFYDLVLLPDSRLSGSIDGISGATLSVKAVTRASRAALFFHSMLP